jgi:hypothetical protein
LNLFVHLNILDNYLISKYQKKWVGMYLKIVFKELSKLKDFLVELLIANYLSQMKIRQNNSNGLMNI